jgi:zona occludens toxin
MPIEIYTGLPGHGKTSFMVKRLLVEAAKNARPIYYSGIDGLAPGYATKLEDPKQWNAVIEGQVCHCHDTDNAAPCEAHLVPNGSLIFVDEAWKWFGHLQEARGPTPPHVLALAEHRHRGIDFVWTTQAPAQLYPFARSMVADHHHHVRRFGTQFVDVFTWAELNEDVKSASKRESAQRKTAALPSDTHDKFKSAEVHTIKRRIPFKVMALPALLVAVVVIGWLAYQKMKPENVTARLQGKEGQAAIAAGPDSLGAGGPGAARHLYTTAAEYVEAFTPRIASMPWTAPAYDGALPVAKPVAVCMSSKAGLDGNGEFKPASCSCITEQGTRYLMPEQQCKTQVAMGGIYNPFKEPSRDLAPSAFAASQTAMDPNGFVPVGASSAPGAEVLQDLTTGIP